MVLRIRDTHVGAWIAYLLPVVQTHWILQGDGSELTGFPLGIFSETGSFYATTNNIQISGSLNVSGSNHQLSGSMVHSGSLTLSGSLFQSGSITTDGDIRATGDVIANYTSDITLKDNIETLTGTLDKIDNIRGVEFDWNNNQQSYTGHDIGVVAQEVELEYPDLVVTRNNGIKAVKYEKLVAVLIEAIKDLNEKIEKLNK